jgi:hypothetical protein
MSTVNIDWGHQGFALVNIAEAFQGVDISGATDCSAGVQTAMGACSGASPNAGQTAFPPAGTYTIESVNGQGTTGPGAIAVPSGAKLETASGAVFQVPAAASLAIAFGALHAVPIATGTLAAAPTEGANPQTISVTIGTAPVAGNYLYLTKHGPPAEPECEVFKIVSVSGTGPYVCTVNEPTAFPWLLGDDVALLAAIPQDITLDFTGSKATGTFTGEFFETTAGQRITVRGLTFDDSLSVPTSNATIVGFDNGTHDSVIEDYNWQVAGTLGFGFFMQSNKRSIARRGVVRGAATAGILFDCYQCGVEDHWAINASSCGLTIGQFAASTPGSRACWIRGGGSIGCAVGTTVNASQDSTITDRHDDYATGTAACQVIGNSLRTRFTNYSATNSAIGITVAAGSTGTRFINLDTTGSTNYATFNEFVTVEGWTSSGSAGGAGGTGVWLYAGGDVRNANLDFGTAGQGLAFRGSYGYLVDSQLKGVDLVVRVNLGGILYLANTTINATGGGNRAIYVDSTGTLNIGPGVVLTSGTFNPQAGSTITMMQTGGVAAVSATASLTFAQHYNTAIELAAGAGADSTITTYAIPGMQWVARNLSAHNLILQTTTAGTVTVAAGKSALVAVNAAGVMARVTPDT